MASKSPVTASTASLSPFLLALLCLCSIMMQGMTILFGFTIRRTDLWLLAVLAGLCFALCLPSGSRMRDRLTGPLQTCVAVVAILDFTLVFPWQAQAFALPLVDDTVRGIDLALGFDHVAWMRWLNANPGIRAVLDVSYRCMIPQMVVVIGLYAASGRYRALDRYLAAFAIAIFLTSILSIAAPTRGIVAFLDPAWRGTPSWPHGATDVAAYDALRSGALRDLSGRPELGIISFPSFHAASAVLSAWSFWVFPSLRLPAIVLDGIMSIATVGCGGHYVMDVAAGHLVAGLAILLAVRGSDLGYRLLDRLASSPALLYRPTDPSARVATAERATR